MSERQVAVTRQHIAAYAEASGDHNPIHLDDEFARSVGLPGVIAHGMLQLGQLASVAVEEAGDPRRIRRLSCRFAGIVRPGDEITYSAEPVEGGLRLSAVNQNGEAVLSKAVAEY